MGQKNNDSIVSHVLRMQDITDQQKKLYDDKQQVHEELVEMLIEAGIYEVLSVNYSRLNRLLDHPHH